MKLKTIVCVTLAVACAFAVSGWHVPGERAESSGQR